MSLPVTPRSSRSVDTSRRIDVRDVRKAFSVIDGKQDGAIDKRELIKALRKEKWIGELLGFREMSSSGQEAMRVMVEEVMTDVYSHAHPSHGSSPVRSVSWPDFLAYFCMTREVTYEVEVGRDGVPRETESVSADPSYGSSASGAVVALRVQPNDVSLLHVNGIDPKSLESKAPTGSLLQSPKAPLAQLHRKHHGRRLFQTLSASTPSALNTQSSLPTDKSSTEGPRQALNFLNELQLMPDQDAVATGLSSKPGLGTSFRRDRTARSGSVRGKSRGGAGGGGVAEGSYAGRARGQAAGRRPSAGTEGRSAPGLRVNPRRMFADAMVVQHDFRAEDTTELTVASGDVVLPATNPRLSMIDSRPAEPEGWEFVLRVPQGEQQDVLSGYVPKAYLRPLRSAGRHKLPASPLLRMRRRRGAGAEGDGPEGAGGPSGGSGVAVSGSGGTIGCSVAAGGGGGNSKNGSSAALATGATLAKERERRVLGDPAEEDEDEGQEETGAEEQDHDGLGSDLGGNAAGSEAMIHAEQGEEGGLSTLKDVAAVAVGAPPAGVQASAGRYAADKSEPGSTAAGASQQEASLVGSGYTVRGASTSAPLVGQQEDSSGFGIAGAPAAADHETEQTTNALTAASDGLQLRGEDASATADDLGDGIEVSSRTESPVGRQPSPSEGQVPTDALAGLSALQLLAAAGTSSTASPGSSDKAGQGVEPSGPQTPGGSPRVVPISIDEAAPVVKQDPRALVSRLPAGGRLAMRYGFRAQGQGELSASKGTVLIRCPDQSKSPDGWLLAWALFDPKAPPKVAPVPGRPHKLPLGYVPASFATSATQQEADLATASWADAATGLSSPVAASSPRPAGVAATGGRVPASSAGLPFQGRAERSEEVAADMARTQMAISKVAEVDSSEAVQQKQASKAVEEKPEVSQEPLTAPQSTQTAGASPAPAPASADVQPQEYLRGFKDAVERMDRLLHSVISSRQDGDAAGGGSSRQASQPSSPGHAQHSQQATSTQQAAGGAAAVPPALLGLLQRGTDGTQNPAAAGARSLTGLMSPMAIGSRHQARHGAGPPAGSGAAPRVTPDLWGQSYHHQPRSPAAVSGSSSAPRPAWAQAGAAAGTQQSQQHTPQLVRRAYAEAQERVLRSSGGSGRSASVGRYHRIGEARRSREQLGGRSGERSPTAAGGRRGPGSVSGRSVSSTRGSRTYVLGGVLAGRGTGSGADGGGGRVPHFQQRLLARRRGSAHGAAGVPEGPPGQGQTGGFTRGGRRRGSVASVAGTSSRVQDRIAPKAAVAGGVTSAMGLRRSGSFAGRVPEAELRPGQGGAGGVWAFPTAGVGAYPGASHGGAPRQQGRSSSSFAGRRQQPVGVSGGGSASGFGASGGPSVGRRGEISGGQGAERFSLMPATGGAGGGLVGPAGGYGGGGVGATEAVQRVAESLGVSARYVTDTRPLGQDTRHMRGLRAISRSVSPSGARLPGY